MPKRASAYAPRVPLAPPQAREGSPAAWFGPAGDLPDVNVWLALAVEEHPHHAAAREYWATLQAAHPRPILWFCRVTMLGLVRLLCNPKVVGRGALDAKAAWAVYRAFTDSQAVGLLPEPQACDGQLQAYVAAQALPPRLWTDAYLAALAQSSGARLVTFDTDFKRFGLDRWLLLPGAAAGAH